MKEELQVSPYTGSLTREQFLFHEMRLTAALVVAGYSEQEIIQRVYVGNLYQHPTSRMLRDLARVCLNRINAMGHPELTRDLAAAPVSQARQICLYALMKQNRLVRDFMVEVIGEKFQTRDFSFNRADVDSYLNALALRYENVAAWSISTRAKIRQVLVKILVENEYLESYRSVELMPVVLEPDLKDGIEANHDSYLLPAFNCFL